jgi:NACHT domain
LPINGGTTSTVVAVVITGVPSAILVALRHQWIGGHPAQSALLAAAYLIVAGALSLAALTWADLSRRWAGQLSAWISTAVAAHLSRFERRYLRHVRELGRYADQAGMRNVGPVHPQLDDVFVEVGLVLADQQPQSIWDWLRSGMPGENRLVLIGGPGSGKTTLLWHVARQVQHRGRRWRRALPVLLQLQDCVADITGDPAAALPAVIEARLRWLGHAPPPGWVRKRLHAARWVLLADDLDKITGAKERQHVATWLHLQISNYPDNDFLITSRPTSYREIPLTGAKILEVTDLTWEQVEIFVRASYRAGAEQPVIIADDGPGHLLARLRDDPALGRLAVNPLFLTLIVNVHRYGDGDSSPPTRADLYHEMCHVLLRRCPPLQAQSAAVPAEIVLCVLGELAFLIADKQLPLSDKVICELITQALASQSFDVCAEEFLEHALSSGLIRQETGEYFFAHHTFQAYLMAIAIGADPGRFQLLIDRMSDQPWRETALLYAAHSGARALVEAAVDSGEELLALDYAGQDPRLRQRLDDVLRDAVDPDADPGQRDRAATLIAVADLGRTFSLSDGTVCIAPVSQDCYELYSRRHDEYPERPSDRNPGASACGLYADNITRLVKQLNTHFTDCRYRLPNLRDVTDSALLGHPDVLGKCVWYEPDDGDGPRLWSRPGPECPYLITAAQLREQCEADLAGQFRGLLISEFMDLVLSAGIGDEQRKPIELIWHRDLDAIIAKQLPHVWLPDELTRLAQRGRSAIENITSGHDDRLIERMSVVAAWISDAEPPPVAGNLGWSPEKLGRVRIGALTIAAGISRLDAHNSSVDAVARCFVDVAAAATSIERWSADRDDRLVLVNDR